ncbi:MAG: phytoene desaturase family protein [Pseudomonadota bacterium]
MTNNKKAIVIGSGFGGIGAALRTRAKGYDVTILEQCENIGGRAQTYHKDGFKHDAGPTVITAPFLFDELYELFGKKREDYIEFVPLDPWYRFVFEDGTVFDYAQEIDDLLNNISALSEEDKNNYLDLLKMSEEIYNIGFEKLSDVPFNSVSKMMAITPYLVKLQAYKTVWGLISSHLKNDYLRRAFSIQPLLVGGNPFETTSIYCLIHYLERKWGVWFAMGGTTAIIQGLQKLMVEEGVEIKTNISVQEIIVENKKAVGILDHNNETHHTDIIISNADPAHLYENMIKDENQSLSTKLKRKTFKYSMGLFVLYFGTTRRYEDVAHHTIFMSERYKSLLDDIFNKQILTEDLSLYLHRPTATDPSFAPEGQDSFYVLAPVPNLQSGIDWDEKGQEVRDRVVSILEEHLLPGLSETITADFYKTPQDFKDNYSSMFGAGFSIAPHLTQSAWFRYHNKAEGIENLFLTGAGTHPGAGVPGVLSSAKVIEKLIPDVSLSKAA